VARNAVRVAPNQLSRVAAVHAIDARPTRTTMLEANAGRTAAMPPPRTFARPVVSHVAAPTGNRGAFHPESPAANAGRNAAPGIGRNERPQIGNAGTNGRPMPQAGNGGRDARPMPQAGNGANNADRNAGPMPQIGNARPDASRTVQRP